MKIVTVVGARPQFIKAAMVSRALRSVEHCKQVLIHTGQHYDDAMSKVFFDEMDIPTPNYDLGVGSGPHGAQTGRMLEAIEPVLVLEKPDWVLVYGDTNSTLAGALAAAKLKCPVSHVEAGLRSFNRSMPEEINRVLTDHSSDCLFAPTATAVRNLKNEGIAPAKVHLVGDVMYDAALWYGSAASQRSRIIEKLRIVPHDYILATVHRAENTDSGLHLESILEGLLRVARNLPVIFPLHPRTRKMLGRRLEGLSPAIQFIDPVGYLDMIMLEKNARLIATDSGGVQKEAFFFGIPCVTLREETEWTELLELGWNRLAPPLSPENIATAVMQALASPLGTIASPYGDGHAAERIVGTLLGHASATPIATVVSTHEDHYAKAGD